MLVLTRKKGQAITIDDQIVIKIIEIKGKGDKALVRVGIQAPKGAKILREEVEREVAEEMLLARNPSLDALKLSGPK
jgi:carbon storage regulator